MKPLFTKALAVVALLLADFTLSAQPSAAALAYEGPRYPGGPDSLRALVYRSTQLVSPSLAGRAVVQFELKDGQQPANFKLLGPQRGAKSDLTKATQAAMQYLQAQMPAWQLVSPNAEAKPRKNAKVLLALTFSPIPSAQPYVYTDQEPVFSYLTDLLSAQRNPNFKNNPEGAAVLAQMATSYSSMANYVQRQTKYPPQALRNREEGQVTVYFEVAENGAIENPEIIGSAGASLDAEVLRAVRTLRPAASPAMLQGRPVRVYYVIPATFRMI